MFHPQLKKTYPDCPFILSSNNKFNESILSKDQFIDYFSEKCIYNCEYQEIVLNFINQITESNEKIFSKILYCQLDQTIPKQKNITINYHMTCYRDDVSSIINENYESNISWIVVSVSGIVAPANSLNYQLIQKQVKQTKDISSIFDDNYQQLNDNDKQRVCTRKIIMRSTVQNIPEIKSIKINYHVNKTIPINCNTKYNLANFRNQLINSSKAQRLKSNQNLYNQAMKLNQYRIINDESNLINDENINKDIFDYSYEKVGIKKLNGIYSITPIDTGRIKIEEFNDDKLIFFSILCNNDILHITMHNILLS